jgi:hypothetical protein
LEVYSLLALNIVREPAAPTFSSSVPSPMSSWSLVRVDIL